VLRELTTKTSNMQKLAKQILRRVYLGLIATKRQILWQLKRNLRRVDSSIIESYFAERKIRKLHIGCGGNLLSDRLNSNF